MDIILALDKTKVVDNTGKYKIIQEEDFNVLNFEKFSKSSIYIFLDFEFITIKKELPKDANFYFYDLTFLPIYRLDVDDLKSLLECFSLQEIIEVLRETEVKKQGISKEQVLASYQNNLAFLKDDYFDYYLNTFCDEINFYYYNKVKMLNGNRYQQVLNTIIFIDNNELTKVFFEKFISFLKEKVDFDKLYEFIYDKECLEMPEYIAFLFIEKEAAYKIFDTLGYFPVCR